MVIRAESGGVAANRSYNIAAERQQLLEEKECLWKKTCSLWLRSGPCLFRSAGVCMTDHGLRLYGCFKGVATQILPNKDLSPL